MKIRKKLVRFGSILGLMIVILALGGSSLAGFAAADVLAAADQPDNGGFISGKVTSPGGYPLPAALIPRPLSDG